MKSIKKIIQLYYLKPETLVYQAIGKLNQYFNQTVLILATIILTQPIIQAVNLSQQIANSKEELKNITEEIIEKENTLQTKLAEKGNNGYADLTPTKINQQLENLFQKQKIEVNNMQWELEQDKQINITLIQKAKPLFELIHQLNQIDYLRMKELTLTRLDYQQLVQLNATLQLVKQ